MPRALIAALLLSSAACTAFHDEELGGGIFPEDAGMPGEDARSPFFECDEKFLELARRTRAALEAGTIPNICGASPFTKGCPQYELYIQAYACAGQVAMVLGQPIDAGLP